MTEEPEAVAPTVHYLKVFGESDGHLTMKFICTATPDAYCRQRPEDPSIEHWDVNDPNVVLVPGECWAAEWIEACGMEDAIVVENEVVFAQIPVSVSYDEGVILDTIAPHPTLDIPQDNAK